jgi:hypothetical protein
MIKHIKHGKSVLLSGNTACERRYFFNKIQPVFTKLKIIKEKICKQNTDKIKKTNASLIIQS